MCFQYRVLNLAYSCGCGQVWSKLYTFNTLKKDSNWSPHFVVYGDLGYQSGLIIPNITNEHEINYRIDLYIPAVIDFAIDLLIDSAIDLWIDVVIDHLFDFL